MTDKSFGTNNTVLKNSLPFILLLMINANINATINSLKNGPNKKNDIMPKSIIKCFFKRGFSKKGEQNFLTL